MRTLLAAECPEWSGLAAEYLRTSGTDNAMWRLRVDGGDDLVVRLPRRPHAAEGVQQEADLLRALEQTALPAIFRTPTVRHLGEPHGVFPHQWTVLEWLDGTDAWTGRDAVSSSLDAIGLDLAEAVLAIGALAGMPAPARAIGQRGGPIEPIVLRIDRWLGDSKWDAHALVDVDAVRRLATEALEVRAEPVVNVFTHGDLIPGNLLVAQGRLKAVIDWGSAGYGDRAHDFGPAWAVLEGPSRNRFREAVGADDASWIRARTFELEQAVGGVLYYMPRRHALGDVMARTLERILRE